MYLLIIKKHLKHLLSSKNTEKRSWLKVSLVIVSSAHGCILPMPQRACCSSNVKAMRGTSSDTGRMVTVDRLEAGFPASHLLVGVWRARLWAAGEKRPLVIVCFSWKPSILIHFLSPLILHSGAYPTGWWQSTPWISRQFSIGQHPPPCKRLIKYAMWKNVLDILYVIRNIMLVWVCLFS